MLKMMSLSAEKKIKKKKIKKKDLSRGGGGVGVCDVVDYILQ